MGLPVMRWLVPGQLIDHRQSSTRLARTNHDPGAFIDGHRHRRPAQLVEGSLQYSGEFGVRAGNKLALIYSPSINSQWLAIVNFSTEQYINFVPNWATRKTYMFHDLIWPFNKLYPQVEESAFGKQSPAIYLTVESTIGRLIGNYKSASAHA